MDTVLTAKTNEAKIAINQTEKTKNLLVSSSLKAIILVLARQVIFSTQETALQLLTWHNTMGDCVIRRKVAESTIKFYTLWLDDRV